MSDGRLADRLVRVFGTPSPVACITGSAAPRVGRAIALHLADRGYRIVMHAHRSIAEGSELMGMLAERDCQAILVTGPVEDERSVRSWIQQIQTRFGRLDLLVNSAAIWEPKSLEQVTAEDIRRHFEVNTLGSFLCSQQAGLLMTQQANGGAIISIGDWAIARPYRQFAAYFPSKGAIPAMTRSLAIELGTRNPGIRVNAILPGPILLADDTPQSIRDAIVQQCLLKRHGTTEHLCDAVSFLAEHEFMTGVCLSVDGGRSIFAGESTDSIAHPDFISESLLESTKKP